LKRIRAYTGTVDNPMELRNFPFDMDRIELEFRTFSHWCTLDGERSSMKSVNASYRLRKSENPNDGAWLTLWWDGRIGEWDLHGISTKISRSTTIAGQQGTLTPLCLHVTRKSSYYFWKVGAATHAR
jgi:hypothetical protein